MMKSIPISKIHPFQKKCATLVAYYKIFGTFVAESRGGRNERQYLWSHSMTLLKTSVVVLQDQTGQFLQSCLMIRRAQCFYPSHSLLRRRTCINRRLSALQISLDLTDILRAQLRSQIHPAVALDERSQKRLDSIEQGSNLNALIQSEIAALEAISQTLSQAHIDSAADQLANARTIHIIGRGSAGPLVMHFDRLCALGFQTNGVKPSTP